MSNKNKKYFWLKLDKNFFKSHDIEIVEAMPNGKDYILFYLKLLCESISHEGCLRFSDEIPYNDEMLATITRTNIDIVRSAVKVFSQLKMMEVLDDGTIFMRQVEKMIGSETGWAEVKRKQRGQLEDKSGQCPIEKEKDIDKDIDKEKDNRFKKPTIEEIQAYCNERNNNVDANMFFDFYESKGWKVGKNSMKDWKACVRTWEKTKGNLNTKKQVKLPSWYGDYLKDLDEKLNNGKLSENTMSYAEIDEAMKIFGGNENE